MAQHPRPPVGARPGVVTVAALVLAAAGAAAVLDGLVLTVWSSVGVLFTAVAVFLLVVGALEILAAVWVLDLRERGRALGIALAILAAVLNLALLGNGAVLSVLGLVADAFVIYVLYANREYFAA